MGCDIHLYVEKRIDGVWRTADVWTPDKYEPRGMTVSYENRLYTGRSYDLFAMLANVRNGRGFAGVKTGDGFAPLAAPRGVPDDACPEYRAEAEHWGPDGHSHSYATVAELLGYDWTRTTDHSGYVSLTEWCVFRAKGKPASWSGDVIGGNVRRVESADVEAAWLKIAAERGWHPVRIYALKESEEALSEMANLLGGGSVYTRVEWNEPYYVSAAGFLSETMPKLWRLGAPDDVRIVFFFDN